MPAYVTRHSEEQCELPIYFAYLQCASSNWKKFYTNIVQLNVAYIYLK
jgi:hypothetical protein